MRPWWMVLLLLPMLPAATAWEDPSGDHEVGMTYATLDNEPQIQWFEAETFDWYPEADLLSAEVAETQNDIIFKVTWQDNKPDDPTAPQEFFRLNYVFDFTLRGQEMRGFFSHFMDPRFADFEYFAIGMRDDEAFDGIRYTSGWPAERTSETSLQVTFPKQYFRDADFVPLRQGDVLEDIEVHAWDDDFGFPNFPPFSACPVVDTTSPRASARPCAWNVRDQVGDDALGDFTVELAPEGVGHLLMRSPTPWRLSNGLATTYVFEVEVHNFDDEPDEVLLAASDIPNGWDVQHPASVSFSDAGVETVPVAVTVPFLHEHGRTELVQIDAASERDPGVEVSQTLGIIYADPAQPGGHHPTIWFHARENPFFSPWMNTDGNRGDDEGTRAEGWTRRGNTLGGDTSTSWEWDIRLSPSLQMGLDFDLSGQVEAELSIEMPVDLTGEVSGRLYLGGEELLTLAELEAGSIDFAGGIPTELVLTGTPSAEADRVPRGSGNLYLEFTVEAEPDPATAAQLFTNDQAVLIVDESRMDLPLFDYHEEVDLSDYDLNAFTIRGNRTFAELNPGDTIAFVFNVTNHLAQQQTLSWQLSGPNAEWGTVEPAETTVPATGDGRVVVRVVAPENAAEGEAAELLLLGTASGAEGQQVFIRLSANVVTEEEIPDESAVADEIAKDVASQNKKLDKDSPGFEAIALIALVGAVAALMRRRH